jgi:enoyl-[acyl-carrier-protein] reductase (NADH)
MINDYKGKAVLITGGTKGIGLATGLAFGKAGAHCYLTHRWGSADEGEVRAQFEQLGAPAPEIVEADVSQADETKAVMARIKEQHDAVEALVSNVTVVPKLEGVEDLSKRALFKSLEYSTWPMLDYLQQAHEILGRYPRYLVGMSTDGVDHYYQGYDYVALTKVVMEVFGRYLSKHLLNEDIRINMVRTRNVITESALAIHGEDYPDFVRKYSGEAHFVQAEEVGNVIFALCSGLLDAMAGQIITVDNGGSFSDGLMRVYHRREEFGL